MVFTNYTEYPQPHRIPSYNQTSQLNQNKHLPPSDKRLLSKCSFYYKPDDNLTVTKIKCIWGK